MPFYNGFYRQVNYYLTRNSN